MEQLFQQFPWMALLGPLIGAIVLHLKQEEMLKGWQLFWAAALATVAVIGTFGLSQGWTVEEWRNVPFVVLVIISGSNFTSSTLEHLAVENLKKVIPKLKVE